jgi:hypothetical protein
MFRIRTLQREASLLQRTAYAFPVIAPKVALLISPRQLARNAVKTGETTVRHHTFAAAVLLIAGNTISGLGTAATPDIATGHAPRDLATALQAVSPHSTMSEPAKVFTRLIGAWDVEYTDFTSAGKTLHRTGELQFGWVMDGRVLQDLWIVNPTEANKEREVYTDLFYFEPKSGSWHAASVDPYAASVATFVGGAIGNDRIVLESQDLDPKQPHRWSFNGISADSLVFRDETSNDGGKTWQLKSEYHMKRRGSIPAI